MINVQENHLATIKCILREYVPDCEVRAYGSRITSNIKPYSDLDLAIVGHGRIDSMQIILLKEAFEESNIPFRVDVLDWFSISENFRKIINKRYETIQTGA